jgi:FemAB-related protein (PEP-CTERM system-associated)
MTIQKENLSQRREDIKINKIAIEVSILDETDRLLWDNYVQSHPNHSPYHMFGWLQSVHQAYGHSVKHITAKTNDKIVGILPVVLFSIPFLGSSIRSLPYCDVGGCLADSEEIKLKLEAKASEIKSSTSAKQIEYRERGISFEDEDLTGKKVCMILSLPNEPNTLMNGFKSKLRSQIRKAEKNGLEFEIGTEKKLIDEFYQILSKNMLRLGSPVHSKEWYYSICREYKFNCTISIVRKQSTPVGGGLILFSKDRACIPWASTLAEYNKLSPNMLLYWSLLRYSVEHGCKQFDFGRSTYNEGTFKFKQQWGASPVLLDWRTDNPSETIPSVTNNKLCSLRKLIENTWRMLPLSIANFIGPKMRRYISL